MEGKTELPEEHDMYASPVIRGHYESEKSRALAYLMTVGSKALVLTDLNDGQLGDIEHHDSMRKSFSAEASIKSRMIMDEKIRQLRRMLNQKPGIYALKRGRNNKSRRMHIRLKERSTKHGAYLVWKSKLAGKGSFDLDNVLNVDLIPQDSTNQLEPRTNLLVESKLRSSFIRITNPSRVLDLQLDTEDLTCVFIEMIAKDFISGT
jgi:hypothetical protein